MIKAQKILVNSLPHGTFRQLADEFHIEKSEIKSILFGEVNPELDRNKKVVERAGQIAALEIFKFGWDERGRK